MSGLLATSISLEPFHHPAWKVEYYLLPIPHLLHLSANLSLIYFISQPPYPSATPSLNKPAPHLLRFSFTLLLIGLTCGAKYLSHIRPSSSHRAEGPVRLREATLCISLTLLRKPSYGFLRRGLIFVRDKAGFGVRLYMRGYAMYSQCETTKYNEFRWSQISITAFLKMYFLSGCACLSSFRVFTALFLATLSSNVLSGSRNTRLKFSEFLSSDAFFKVGANLAPKSAHDLNFHTTHSSSSGASDLVPPTPTQQKFPLKLHQLPPYGVAPATKSAQPCGGRWIIVEIFRDKELNYKGYSKTDGEVKQVVQT
eukprot:sb/3467083/